MARGTGVPGPAGNGSRTGPADIEYTLPLVDGNADDARLVFDVTATTRQVDALQAQVDAQAVALSETVADRDTIATDRNALRVMVSSVTTERDGLQGQVLILTMRVDALTLMRDQIGREHERTVDALQALVTSQREIIDTQSTRLADLSQQVRWWPSVLRALGLGS